jgi:hypothetical protein
MSDTSTPPVPPIDDFIEDALMLDETEFCARVPFGALLCEPDLSVGSAASARKAPTFVAVEETADVIPDWARGARTPGNEVFFAAPLRKRPGLPHADRILIGRTDENDVVMPHASVSRAHGYILLGQELVVVDAGSRHGTYARDERLLPNHPYPLVSGRRIRFGAVRTLYLAAPSFFRYCRARPVADHASRTLDGR